MVIDIDKIPDEGLALHESFEFDTNDLIDESAVFLKPVSAEIFIKKAGDEVLIKGRIKLTLGEKSREVYVAYQPGEIIGWSALIGRETLSATAQCLEPTTVGKMDRNAFLGILDRYPTAGAALFQRVAAMLGNRLVKLYPTIA